MFDQAGEILTKELTPLGAHRGGGVKPATKSIMFQDAVLNTNTSYLQRSKTAYAATFPSVPESLPV